MERCAYLINTTPKYFHLLDLHLTLLERYAPTLLKKMPVYLATEVPYHETILKLRQLHPTLHIIPLTQEQEGFFESRLAATIALPSNIDYVFPIQEDFLLEARPLISVLEECIGLFDSDADLASARLMPCPGPRMEAPSYKQTAWKQLLLPDMLFSYQATIWRRAAYRRYMEQLLASVPADTTKEERLNIAIHMNLAEIHTGQMLLKRQGRVHLAYPREGGQPNAVYLCPWPYRPTAVVKGRLETWAVELAARENIPLLPSNILNTEKNTSS